jgi:hypothetical protein
MSRFFPKGHVLGYGNLEYLKNEGIDILSMIRVDEEEQDEGRSFSSEALKIQDQQVTFRPKLKRNASYSPGISRRKKHTSLHDDLHDPLLLLKNGDALSRTQSAHDLETFSPDIVHTGRLRAATSIYDIDLVDREEVLSQVSAKI